MCAIYEDDIHLPSGQTYQQGVGSLALGRNPSQWTMVDDGGIVEGHVLTGVLAANGTIPSQSWGLHIGSVPHALEGSLILGGYDQNRLTGDVGMFDIATGPGAKLGNPLVAPLADISLSTEVGSSPFPLRETNGLLGTSTGKSILININPALPYMYLPREACDAIAANLSVTFQ